MPLSFIGLSVSHLPTSCSFFLAALSHLGYRYMGQQDNKIGFGIDQAEFYLCQQPHGTCLGAAHVTFSAPSTRAVISFFHNALKAGGSVHGEPAVRDPKTGYYSAAVIDFDGNFVEVHHRPESHLGEERGVELLGYRHDTGVRKWRECVAESTGSHNITGETYEVKFSARNIATSALAVPQQLLERRIGDDAVCKTLIGALAGAAASAAITYVMTKSEQKSMLPQSFQPAFTGLSRAFEGPPPSISVSSTNRYQTSKPASQAFSDASPHSEYKNHCPRAIEAPGSTQSRSLRIDGSKFRTETSQHSIQEFLHPPTLPKRSDQSLSGVSPMSTRTASVRSSTSSAARTVVQGDYLPATSLHRTIKSSIASNRKDQEVERRSACGTSNCGIYTSSLNQVGGPFIEEADGAETVAPSDSIRQAGSKRSRYKHRSCHSEQKDEGKESRRSFISLPVQEFEGERLKLGKRSVVSHFLTR